MDSILSSRIVPITDSEVLAKHCSLDSVKGFLIHILPYSELSVTDHLKKLGRSYHFISDPSEKIYQCIPITQGAVCSRLVEYNLKAIKIFGREYCPFSTPQKPATKSPDNVAISFAGRLGKDNKVTPYMMALMARLMAYLIVSQGWMTTMNINDDIVFHAHIQPFFKMDDPTYGHIWNDTNLRIQFRSLLKKYIGVYLKTLSQGISI